jgi:uncharacterized protein
MGVPATGAAEQSRMHRGVGQNEGQGLGNRRHYRLFSCDDCAVEASRAGQNGGRVQKPKESIGQYGFIALVYDTEGNLIGLHSMV